MDPMGYRNPGIPISTASSTMEALLSACCARLFLSKKTGFPRYGVWKPRAAWMEPNLMLLEMWAVMNKNTPHLWTPKPWKMKVLGPQYMGHNLQKWWFWVPLAKTNMGVYGMNFYTNDVGIIVNSYKDP